nr:hypothetical protein [uncultured Sediminibacterium sp.]
MRFSNVKITGSLLGILLASVGLAQTYSSGQGNIQVANVRTTPGNAIVISDNGYTYTINDTTKPQELKSKEISQEIAMPKGGEIYIENSSIALQVKTWDQPKVKLVTTVYYENESNLTDIEWFDKVGISLKALGTSVKIKSNNTRFGSNYSYTTTDRYSLEPVVVSGFRTSTFNSVRVANIKTQKKILVIYVPAGSKMDIESKYADVQLPTGIGDVLLDISNGNFEAENLNKLRLRSKYSNANVRDIKEAEIEFANGRFSANNIDDLDIESKYATIEMASAKKIKMISTNDEFEVEDAAEISGRKNYGNLRITRLTSSLELDGSNADIKVRNVGSNVKLIKVDNRYADIRIPLRDTKNYGVNFLGSYSTVYGDFEKNAEQVTEADVTAMTKSSTNSSNTVLYADEIVVKGTLKASNVPLVASTAPKPATGGTLMLNRSGSNTPVKFSATVGDGKGLKIDMKCQNCTVDFK